MTRLAYLLGIRTERDTAHLRRQLALTAVRLGDYNTAASYCFQLLKQFKLLAVEVGGRYVASIACNSLYFRSAKQSLLQMGATCGSALL